ncbi:hypothetical protein EXE43_21185 [Halorubrum sp. SS5]|nr:hypothetical protein EXE43_21185 [Halorubrum sp. SS5]
MAGGGALLGTGAFTTVTAERTVNVETAGDASAFLGLTPADRDGSGGNEYVDSPGDGTIEITLVNNDDTDGNASGLNQNAKTVFRNLVTITNNGTQDVETLNLEFITGGDLTESELDSVFDFTVSPSGNGNNGSQSTIDNGDDVISDSYYSDNSPLSAGESINFGISINLLDSGVSDLPADGSYTLQITAETANTNN